MSSRDEDSHAGGFIQSETPAPKNTRSMIRPFIVPQQPTIDHLLDTRSFRRLKNALDEAGTNGARIALIGLAGIGKTVTCLHVARACETKYDGILWIDCRTKQTATDAFESLGRLCQLPHVDYRRVRNWLSSCTLTWLLVFDNVDFTHETFDVEELLPTKLRGNVIFASRDLQASQLASDPGNVLYMDPFSENEAIQALLRTGHVPAVMHPEHVDVAADIVRLLGTYPLAIRDAGAYIARQSDLKSCLSELQSAIGRTTEEQLIPMVDIVKEYSMTQRKALLSLADENLTERDSFTFVGEDVCSNECTALICSWFAENLFVRDGFVHAFERTDDISLVACRFVELLKEYGMSLHAIANTPEQEKAALLIGLYRHRITAGILASISPHFAEEHQLQKQLRLDERSKMSARDKVALWFSQSKSLILPEAAVEHTMGSGRTMCAQAVCTELSEVDEMAPLLHGPDALLAPLKSFLLETRPLQKLICEFLIHAKSKTPTRPSIQEDVGLRKASGTALAELEYLSQHPNLDLHNTTRIFLADLLDNPHWLPRIGQKRKLLDFNSFVADSNFTSACIESYKISRRLSGGVIFSAIFCEAFQAVLYGQSPLVQACTMGLLLLIFVVYAIRTDFRRVSTMFAQMAYGKTLIQFECVCGERFDYWVDTRDLNDIADMTKDEDDKPQSESAITLSASQNTTQGLSEGSSESLLANEGGATENPVNAGAPTNASHGPVRGDTGSNSSEQRASDVNSLALVGAQALPGHDNVDNRQLWLIFLDPLFDNCGCPHQQNVSSGPTDRALIRMLRKQYEKCCPLWSRVRKLRKIKDLRLVKFSLWTDDLAELEVADGAPQFPRKDNVNWQYEDSTLQQRQKTVSWEYAKHLWDTAYEPQDHCIDFTRILDARVRTYLRFLSRNRAVEGDLPVAQRQDYHWIFNLTPKHVGGPLLCDRPWEHYYDTNGVQRERFSPTVGWGIKIDDGFGVPVLTWVLWVCYCAFSWVLGIILSVQLSTVAATGVTSGLIAMGAFFFTVWSATAKYGCGGFIAWQVWRQSTRDYIANLLAGFICVADIDLTF